MVDVDDETDDDDDDEDIVAAMYWLSGTGEGNTPAIYTKINLNDTIFNYI